jgi:hypothetical protein
VLAILDIGKVLLIFVKTAVLFRWERMVLSMDKIIKKINKEIGKANTNRVEIHNSVERDAWNNGYDNGVAQGLVMAKALILSEQPKEPCEYCQGEVDNRKYIIEANDGIGCYIDGSGFLDINDDYDIKINFCPMCGRPILPSTDTP